MEEKYKDYFGVSATPDNFARLLYLANNELEKISKDTDNDDYEKAVLEQIFHLSECGDLLVTGQGYSLGKFREGPGEKVEKISPIAKDILINAGLIRRVVMC